MRKPASSGPGLALLTLPQFLFESLNCLLEFGAALLPGFLEAGHDLLLGVQASRPLPEFRG